MAFGSREEYLNKGFTIYGHGDLSNVTRAIIEHNLVRKLEETSCAI